jgi:hypothetical protein
VRIGFSIPITEAVVSCREDPCATRMREPETISAEDESASEAQRKANTISPHHAGICVERVIDDADGGLRGGICLGVRYRQLRAPASGISDG